MYVIRKDKVRNKTTKQLIFCKILSKKDDYVCLIMYTNANGRLKKRVINRNRIQVEIDAHQRKMQYTERFWSCALFSETEKTEKNRCTMESHGKVVVWTNGGVASEGAENDTLKTPMYGIGWGYSPERPAKWSGERRDSWAILLWSRKGPAEWSVGACLDLRERFCDQFGQYLIHNS